MWAARILETTKQKLTSTNRVNMKIKCKRWEVVLGQSNHYIQIRTDGLNNSLQSILELIDKENSFRKNKIIINKFNKYEE